MRINHNSLALNASNHFSTLNSNISKSMERLSSGYKITSPADDAAGLAISTRLNSQIRGLSRASLNSNDGVSVIQSAEGGLDSMHQILARMRELAVQAANDVNSEDDRDAIQLEVDSLCEELNQIADTTAFNEQALLNGNLTRRSMSDEYSVSATSISDEVNVGVYELSVTADASQASYTSGFTYSNTIVTEEQAGTVTVNGFLVNVNEGMTMTDVFNELQSHLSKINVDVFSTADGGATEVDFTSGSPVMLRTKEFGSNEKLEINISNPNLEAMLGITDGDRVEGTDCKALLTVTDDGFSSTASLTTDGLNIHVVDRNGFDMSFEVEAGAVAANTATLDASIEVFSAGTMNIQIGANSGEQISLDIPAVTTKGLGLDNLVMYTHEYASEAVNAIDKAVIKVSSIRSKLGAYENRLDDNYDTLQVQEESITSAYSRIMDTDMAEEMTNYTEQDVLSQAAISMMQKSNERPESLLQLLQ